MTAAAPWRAIWPVKQIMATVNNPAEAKGFYEAGDFVPLLAFSDERMPAYPDVPTIKEKGHDFSYYNQRAVVGAPGMSDEAAAYYQDLFTRSTRAMSGRATSNPKAFRRCGWTPTRSVPTGRRRSRTTGTAGRPRRITDRAPLRRRTEGGEAMRYGEIVTAGVLALFSIYLMWKSTELPVGYIEGRGPGGGAWPFWLSAIMLCAAAW
jgi:hypothetical protein